MPLPDAPLWEAALTLRPIWPSPTLPPRPWCWSLMTILLYHPGFDDPWWWMCWCCDDCAVSFKRHKSNCTIHARAILMYHPCPDVPPVPSMPRCSCCTIILYQQGPDNPAYLPGLNGDEQFMANDLVSCVWLFQLLTTLMGQTNWPAQGHTNCPAQWLVVWGRS